LAKCSTPQLVARRIARIVEHKRSALADDAAEQPPLVVRLYRRFLDEVGRLGPDRILAEYQPDAAPVVEEVRREQRQDAWSEPLAQVNKRADAEQPSVGGRGRPAPAGARSSPHRPQDRRQVQVHQRAVGAGGKVAHDSSTGGSFSDVR
jgi:hypothetical protein